MTAEDQIDTSTPEGLTQAMFKLLDDLPAFGPQTDEGRATRFRVARNTVDTISKMKTDYPGDAYGLALERLTTNPVHEDAYTPYYLNVLAMLDLYLDSGAWLEYKGRNALEIAAQKNLAECFYLFANHTHQQHPERHEHFKTWRTRDASASPEQLRKGQGGAQGEIRHFERLNQQPSSKDEGLGIGLKAGADDSDNACGSSSHTLNPSGVSD